MIGRLCGAGRLTGHLAALQSLRQDLRTEVCEGDAGPGAESQAEHSHHLGAGMAGDTDSLALNAHSAPDVLTRPLRACSQPGHRMASL